MHGPKYIRHKEVRERVNQYNLKHKENKRADVSEDRLDKPSQGSTLPQANHLNSNFDEISESDIEYEQEKDEESYKEYDEIEDDEY